MDEARDNARRRGGDFVFAVQQVTVAGAALGYEAVESHRIAPNRNGLTESSEQRRYAGRPLSE